MDKRYLKIEHMNGLTTYRKLDATVWHPSVINMQLAYAHAKLANHTARVNIVRESVVPIEHRT